MPANLAYMPVPNVCRHIFVVFCSCFITVRMLTRDSLQERRSSPLGRCLRYSIGSSDLHVLREIRKWYFTLRKHVASRPSSRCWCRNWSTWWRLSVGALCIVFMHGGNKVKVASAGVTFRLPLIAFLASFSRCAAASSVCFMQHGRACREQCHDLLGRGHSVSLLLFSHRRLK